MYYVLNHSKFAFIIVTATVRTKLFERYRRRQRTISRQTCTTRSCAYTYTSRVSHNENGRHASLSVLAIVFAFKKPSILARHMSSLARHTSETPVDIDRTQWRRGCKFYRNAKLDFSDNR